MRTNDPINLPDGTYAATVKSGCFAAHRRERGRQGIELMLDVAGPGGVTYEIVYFADLRNLDCLSSVFAAGEDFLVELDPSELAGKRCRAVVRRLPWLPNRPWVEAATLKPFTGSRSVYLDEILPQRVS